MCVKIKKFIQFRIHHFFSYNNRCLDDVVIMHTQPRTISEENKKLHFSFWTFHFQNKNKTFAFFVIAMRVTKTNFSCFSWKIRNHFFSLFKIMVFPQGLLWKTKKLISGPYIFFKKTPWSYVTRVTWVILHTYYYTAMVFHKTKSASKNLQIMHTQWRTISEHQTITICTKIVNCTLFFVGPPSS